MSESYLRLVTSLKHRRDYEYRLPFSQWFYAVWRRLAFTDFCWMRSSWVIRASGPIRNSPGFYPSILRHSRIWGAADEAVLNNVSKKKKCNENISILFQCYKLYISYFLFYASFSGFIVYFILCAAMKLDTNKSYSSCKNLVNSRLRPLILAEPTAV